MLFVNPPSTDKCTKMWLQNIEPKEWGSDDKFQTYFANT